SRSAVNVVSCPAADRIAKKGARRLKPEPKKGSDHVRRLPRRDCNGNVTRSSKPMARRAGLSSRFGGNLVAASSWLLPLSSSLHHDRSCLARREHRFQAVAFVENLNHRDLQAKYREGKASVESIRVSLPDGGEEFLYPFGAVVFHDASVDRQLAEIQKLRQVF